MHPSQTELLHRGGAHSAWGNLGLWPAPDYATACCALADAVARAGGLRRGYRVLSPGCGSGEELRRWVDGYGALLALGLEPDSGIPQAPKLPVGARRLQARATPEPGLTSDLSHPFDVVLCVDAAYHFSPRLTWLKQARQALRAGGRIAFTDLTLTRRWLPLAAARQLLRPACAAAQIDAHELLPLADARQRLHEAGFGDIQATAVDTAVLDGFVDFVRCQTRSLGVANRGPGWRRVAGTAAWLRLAKPLGLGYTLFSATAAD